MAGRRSQNRASVYDELICHLEGIYFQIPVMSFIDRHCSIFDPHQEDDTEYRKVWAAYKSLVTQLLESFREDSGLSQDKIIEALADMDKLSDIHELYKGLFAQVFATESFEIFKNMMVQKNIELQQQLLLIILSQSGFIPSVLLPDDAPRSMLQPGRAPAAQPGRGPTQSQASYGRAKQVQSPLLGGRSGAPSAGGGASAPSAPAAEGPMSEEAILAAVIRQSQTDHENAEKRRNKQDETMMAKALVMSKEEAQRLQQEHHEQEVKLTRAVQDIALNDPPQPGASHSSPEHRQAYQRAPAKPTAGSPKKGSPMKATPPQQSPVKEEFQPGFTLGAQSSGISGEQAASAWLSSALQDAEQDGSLRRFTKGSGDLSPEEMKKRQEFLKDQRDKLIQMKAKEREKHLKNAEKANPGRPSSARAAKNALKDDGASQKIDDKTLAMRRAIANKLKAEVIVERGDEV